MGNSGDIINGRYKIIHGLGEGGFGKTYLAKDTELPTKPHCVIKHLQPRFNSPSLLESAKERFAKEGRSLERLGSHPQIPQLFAYVEENEEFYLIQEWIDGEELRREVSRKVFDESKAINLLKDCLDVLSFVHQQGVIHRDIKPSNLLRRRSDQKIILIDFGAVKEIETLTYQAENPTIQTQAIGTPGYMSPEQLYGKPVFSSDLYALGRTIIFALTGRSPIELEDTQTGDLKNWQPSIPLNSAFKAILTKMISPRLGERYQSAYEVLQDLAPLSQVGKILGDRYRIIEFLGGSVGRYTYLAENISRPYQSPCVIKQLTLPQDEKVGKTRILQELKVLENLGSYQRIPQLLDHLEIEPDFYLVQEYIEGQTLNKMLRQRTCLTEKQVINLLKEVLTTLAFIHENQVIHRDIKPSNLIWQTNEDEPRSDRCFLIDLGGVKEILNSVTDSMTENSRPPKSIGTKGYMSPEQMAGRPVFASDIYSLGMTAIQALTGQSPQTFQSHSQTGAMIWPSEVTFNKKLVKILEKMTRLDLDKRYSSAKEVLKDLRKLEGMSARITFYSAPRWSILALLGGGTVIIGGLFFYGLNLHQTAFLLRKGDLELKSENYQSAIRYYDDALSKAPPLASSILTFERAFLQKALAYSALGEPEKMLQTCEEAINFRPQSSHGWNCKGTALDELDRQKEAIQSFNTAIQQDPNSFEAWHNRGLLYAELENQVQAEADLKQAIQLNLNTSHVSWNDLGQLYYRFEDYPQAIEAYQEAVKLKADYLPAWVGLGNTYRKLTEYQAAIEVYNRAIAIAPDSDEAWYSKGLAAEALERYEDAYEFYDQARVLNPKQDVYRQAQQRVRSFL
ncbi:MAG: protein kinase [Microcystaceae cyanobacterium]